MGGTFNKSNFAKAIGFTANEILPIVAPIGYEGGKKSLIGKIIGTNKNKRKDFSEIFFEGSFTTSLLPENAGEFRNPLNMLRLAPSAVNKQPWRALKIGETIQFYLISTKGWTRIDLGIGLCHFDLTAREMGMNGMFLAEEGFAISSEYTYVISWTKAK